MQHYLDLTSERERRFRCRILANSANEGRFWAPRASVRLTWEDVDAIMREAQGRCVYCRSLALEVRPTAKDGKTMPWKHIGRRIGSLEHVKRRAHGGDNERENLLWACLWCNTTEAGRQPFAKDHGAIP